MFFSIERRTYQLRGFRNLRRTLPDFHCRATEGPRPARSVLTNYSRSKITSRQAIVTREIFRLKWWVSCRWARGALLLRSPPPCSEPIGKLWKLRGSYPTVSLFARLILLSRRWRCTFSRIRFFFFVFEDTMWQINSNVKVAGNATCDVSTRKSYSFGAQKYLYNLFPLFFFLFFTLFRNIKIVYS